MPAAAVIRLDALRLRAEILGPDAGIVPATTIVERGATHAGLSLIGLDEHDPLLAGAFAVLDRESGCIWHNNRLPDTVTRFNLAHELAHWQLHTDACAGGAEGPGDPGPFEPPPFGEAYVSGYSPAQRREAEANLFAAELLLPLPLVREAFLGGMTYSALAAAAQVSETLALSQLTEAVLADWRPPADERPLAGAATPPGSHGVSAYLESLDDSQRRAALAQGPVLVSAGPGTGKTRTLVGRLLALAEGGVQPESILALTYSNRAAAEMRERIEGISPPLARRLWIGTFHAFGLELLRRFGSSLNLPPSPALLDSLDALELVEKNLHRFDLREYEYLHDPAFPFRDLLGAFSRAKDELAGPSRYAELAEAMPVVGKTENQRGEAERARNRALEAARVYAAWQEVTREHGALDFGDLISRSVELLQECPDARRQIRREFRHILVDEYQDINRASAVLVRLLAGSGAGLWAVGDLRQAIYRFRGASPANLQAFERDYPQGRRLNLEVNYRSQPALVDLFGETARRMAAGSPEDGWTAYRSADSQEILLAVAQDETAQADGIARMARRFESDGIPLNNQAVLCRTNTQADRLAAGLESRGAPVLHLGSLFERSEVKDLLALLSCAVEAGGAILRVGALREYSLATEERIRIAQCSTALADSEGEPEPSHGLQRLRSHLRPLAFKGDAWGFFARYLFGDSGYLRGLLAEPTVASRQACLALYQLLQTARAHAERLRRSPQTEAVCPQRDFLAFVRRLIASGEDMRVRIPPEAAGPPALRIMTIHASKGLEFPVVFLPHLAKGQFPTRKQGGMVKLPPGLADDSEEGGAAEDECLFFVALSRARDRLVMVRPAQVNGRDREPTPLLQLLGQSPPHEWWQARLPDPAKPPEPPATTPADRSFTASGLEQYLRCPRQYYYARVLAAQVASEDTPWLAAQKCIWAVLRWAREMGASGDATPESSMAKLDEEWAASGPPPDYVFHDRLLERARAIVSRLPFDSGLSRESTRLRAELEAGSVSLDADFAARDADGALVVERWKAGRPRDDDHTAPRLALMRLAARNAGEQRVVVRLRYLAAGAITEVPEQPKHEPGRISRYERAAAGAAAGHFPADPDSPAECERCPYHFICPA